jgi:hypothetical protein
MKMGAIQIVLGNSRRQRRLTSGLQQQMRVLPQLELEISQKIREHQKGNRLTSGFVNSTGDSTRCHTPNDVVFSTPIVNSRINGIIHQR